MPTLRDIRRRISGVKSTQKITKAMKMVSAAKLRRAQDAIVSARPYARALRDLLIHLTSKHDVTAHPLFAERPAGKIALIVVSSDRGLCGSFNTNILKSTTAQIQKKYPEHHAGGG